MAKTTIVTEVTVILEMTTKESSAVLMALTYTMNTTCHSHRLKRVRESLEAAGVKKHG